jgi:hypothetical protein
VGGSSTSSSTAHGAARDKSAGTAPHLSQT